MTPRVPRHPDHPASSPTSEQGVALVPSPRGPFAIAWRGREVTRVWLPARSPRALERHIQETLLRSGAARAQAGPVSPLPRRLLPFARKLAQAICGYEVSFAHAPLAWGGVDGLRRDIYQRLSEVPHGHTTSYGALAADVGRPGAARAVGRAMATNPWPLVIPCHRVVASGGRVGGFTAPLGVTFKERLLRDEQQAKLRAVQLFDARGRVAREPEVRAALCARDPILAKFIQRIGPCSMQQSKHPSPFAALARAVIFQQLTGKAAETIFGRVLRASRSRSGYTDRTDSSHAESLRAEDIAHTRDADLREAGLSANKLAALRALTSAEQRGDIPSLREMRRLTDDDIIATLTQIRGIGRWTVEMFLMFTLGRVDVLSLGDLGLCKGFLRLYRGRAAEGGGASQGTKAALAERSARWAPYRSVASWYLWRASENAVT